MKNYSSCILWKLIYIEKEFMNILFVSYQNIWPFENSALSLNFWHWKYLIKAPIWSWKSFIFFDGPLFWLYKYSSRAMLNKNSNQGFIKIIFEINQEIFLISRFLKPTKAWWESVTTYVYKINSSVEEINWYIGNQNEEVITKNYDIIGNLPDEILEEIKFKSSAEAQKHLDELLPPRHVFLNTNFLMQEWENIFQLTPAERINVFKNIFNLIGIDHAKDIILDNKKQVQTYIKAKQDLSIYDNKLHSKIKELSSNNIENIQEFFSENTKSFIDETVYFQDKISIKEFSMDEVDFQDFDNAKIHFDTQKRNYQELITQKENLKNQIKSTEEKISNLEETKKQKQAEKKQLEDFVQSIDKNKIKSLQEKKNSLLEKQNQIEKSINYQLFSDYGYEVNDIYEAYQKLHNLKSEWKNLSSSIENADLELRNLESNYTKLTEKLQDLDIENETTSSKMLQEKKQTYKSSLESKITKIDADITSLEEKKTNFKNQLDSINERIDKIDNDIKTQKTFYCDKIKDNCPYLDQIKEDTINQINSQKKELEKEKNSLLEKWNNEEIDKNLESKKQEKKELEAKKEKIENNPEEVFKDFFDDIQQQKQKIQEEINQLDYSVQKQKITQKKQENQKKLDNLREFFSKINWKTFESQYQEYKELDQQIKDIHQEVYKMEQQLEKLEEYQQKLVWINKDIENLDSQIQETQNQLESYTKQLKETEWKISSLDIKKIESLEGYMNNVYKLLQDISWIIQDYQQSKLEIKKLQEDEKILSDLYIVFSKELMLVILDDFLPQLEQVINTILSNVVDFEVSFDLERKASEKLELEINIKDKYWQRPVKSLSWGQTTVLKIAWILAIASFLRCKFLFLDETINNLDAETVGKVSVILEDFINQNNIKFYVVTHSHQIQSMQIWDKVVELKN